MTIYFASVTASGNAAGCTGACVYSFQIPIARPFDTTSTSSTINSNAPHYINISTTTALNATETSVDTALSTAEAGTYNRMTITQSAASPNRTTLLISCADNTANNPANTTLTCAIAAGATTCSDTANTSPWRPTTWSMCKSREPGATTPHRYNIPGPIEAVAGSARCDCRTRRTGWHRRHRCRQHGRKWWFANLLLDDRYQDCRKRCPSEPGGIELFNAANAPMCLNTAIRIEHLKSEDQKLPVPGTAVKKPYLKPAFRHEKVFETMALACGKIAATQRQCGSNRKTS